MFAYEPNIKRKRHVGCSWMRALVMKMESHRICISWRKLCLQMAGAHINSAGLTQNGIALTVQKNKSHSCISVCWRPWGHLCQGLAGTVTRRARRDIRFSKKKTPVTRTHVYMNFPRFNLHLVIHDLVHMHFFATLMIRNRWGRSHAESKFRSCLQFCRDFSRNWAFPGSITRKWEITRSTNFLYEMNFEFISS